MSKYILLVPAYKPEIMMLDLLKEAKEAGFEIVVVDDGGGAEFAAIFEKAAEFGKILTHPVNCGKGRALKTGLKYISENYSKDAVIVTVDADGQHRVSDALKLCDLAAQQPDALMLGSRKLQGEVPFRSKFGNAMTRAVYHLSTGLKVHDTQTGLRAFTMQRMEEMLEIPGDRYEYEMNVLLEFARRHYPIHEMEIPTIYINDNSGSHFNPLKDSFRIYKEILKFSMSSMISFVVDYVLYTLLLVLTRGNLKISNVVARLISATVNYTLNRKFVFKSKSGVAKSVIEYALLAIVILVGNTFVLSLLVEQCGLNSLLAKLLTEIAFFVLSWFVQRFVIFRKK